MVGARLTEIGILAADVLPQFFIIARLTFGFQMCDSCSWNRHGIVGGRLVRDFGKYVR